MRAKSRRVCERRHGERRACVNDRTPRTRHVILIARALYKSTDLDILTARSSRARCERSVHCRSDGRCSVRDLRPSAVLTLYPGPLRFASAHSCTDVRQAAQVSCIATLIAASAVLHRRARHVIFTERTDRQTGHTQRHAHARQTLSHSLTRGRRRGGQPSSPSTHTKRTRVSVESARRADGQRGGGQASTAAHAGGPAPRVPTRPPPRPRAPAVAAS